MHRREQRKTGTISPIQAGLNGNGNNFDRKIKVEGLRDIKIIPGNGKLPREVDVTPDLAAFKMSNRIGRLVSGGHVTLHEYIAKIMACFNRFERFSIYIDRSQFMSLFESQWMRKAKNGARKSELSHYLTVDRNNGTYSPRAIESYVLSGESKSVEVFRESKPTLINYDEGDLLEFTNMDPDSDICVYDTVVSPRTGMKAFFPIPYGDPARSIGLNIMEGDLTLRGSRLRGLANLYLSGIPFASASALIADQLMHRFDWTTQLSRKEDFEYHFRNLVHNLIKGEFRNGFLLLVDIDKFKEINTKYGLYIGDVLLGQIAAVIRDNVREKNVKEEEKPGKEKRKDGKETKPDIIARWGGDEFGVLISDDGKGKEVTEKKIKEIASRLKAAVSAAYVKLPTEGSDGFDKISRNCSIGVVPLKELIRKIDFEDEEDCCVQIFQKSNEMLDQAKAAGRNGVYRTKVEGNRIIGVPF
jgi:GGDEF domain-containing protein